jgi:hypothetical protein
VTGRRRLGLATVLLVVAAIGGSGTLTTLAAYTDAHLTSGTFASDLLDPPTGLTASGGTTVGLTWAPTVDAYASGYSVWRASISGGPYTSIGTVTPGSAASTTDAPGSGTWSYVLRSVSGGWSSAPSNQASATVDGTPTSLAYAGCLSQAADTTAAGDGDGYQTSPALACADGGGFAQDPNSGSGGSQACGAGTVTPDPLKDRHRFWGFATGLPGSVSAISGIRVRADVGLNHNGGTDHLCAQLSWDGGVSWSTIQSIPLHGTGESTYVLGGTSDTWGRTWTPAELAPTTFVVRIIDAASMTNKRFELDYLAVSVTYTP